MTCRRFRRYLPLLTGGDLPARKAARAAAHLERCPACRRERDAWLRSRRDLLAGMKASRMKWEEREWENVVRAATAPAAGSPRSWRFRSLRPAPALALAALAALILSVFLFGPGGAPPEPGRSAETGAGQDVVAVTLVSRDSGLKVHWFFNREFDLEENQQ